MNTELLLTLTVVLLLAAIAGAVLTRRRPAVHVARRFGPEFDRRVPQSASRDRPAAPDRRDRHSQQLDILVLAPHEVQRYRMEWHALQTRFAVTPRTVVAEADLLVRDVMMRRGYPMADFDTRAAEIARQQPLLVQHYRAAHAIALQDRRGDADTQALRQALVHYREVFAELLADRLP